MTKVAKAVSAIAALRVSLSVRSGDPIPQRLIATH
jgi:hypothetical protein